MPDDSSSLFLRRHPRVVATISSASDWVLAEKIIPAAANAPDLLEVRADLLLENSAQLPGDIATLPLPFILTVRHPSEGGKGPTETLRRASIYEQFWGNAVAIDVELAFAADFSLLLQQAKARGLACILSHHNFTDTPPLEYLVTLTQQAATLGADLFKVATTTNTAPDISTLALWLENEKKLPLAAMGMGALGKISRPLLAQLGSQLNYGYLAAPLVSGQWPAHELRRLIDALENN